MLGRPPKPTALKRIAGNPGKRKLNESEPKFSAAVMRPPRHLPAAAKREWLRLAPVLYRIGLLDAGSRAMFTAYCQAWSDYVKAEKHIQAEGEVRVTNKGYEHISAWVTVKAKALEQMHKFGAEFGLGNSQRSRIKSEPVTEEKSLAEMLFEGAND